ncbi:MBL fold metallo-hydrolase [candidate division WWE3 bacterium]|nr:MBL fold metallo-hydrolase [candidate division WWE3 bacterium]
MEITYIGHSCFKIKGKNLELVIDPYDPDKTGYKLPKLTTDVVLTSHEHDDHSFLDGVSGYKLAITTPGEYEINDVYIEGITTFHDDKEGKDRGKNTMFQITIDDMNILHVGDLGHLLNKETLEKILDIDVLMVPVGGFYTIDAEEASKLISSIEPGVVIPMHYKEDKANPLTKDMGELKKFLDEMGVENVTTQDKLKITKGEIPEETEVVVLNPTH